MNKTLTLAEKDILAMSNFTDSVTVQFKLPFNCPRLLKEAADRYGYEEKEIFEILYELYNRGLITYPKTECSFLPESLYESAQKMIRTMEIKPSSKNKVNPNLKSPAWDDDKVTTHYAIIPTDCSFAAMFMSQPLTEQQASIYRLVCEGFVQLFQVEAMAN